MSVQNNDCDNSDELDRQWESGQKILKRALAIISEHFDDVLILASSKNSDVSMNFVGSGNFYAHIGMANEYLDKNKAELSEAIVIDSSDDL